jgi:hypothetical protein
MHPRVDEQSLWNNAMSNPITSMTHILVGHVLSPRNMLVLGIDDQVRFCGKEERTDDILIAVGDEFGNPMTGTHQPCLNLVIEMMGGDDWDFKAMEKLVAFISPVFFPRLALRLVRRNPLSNHPSQSHLGEEVQSLGGSLSAVVKEDRGNTPLAIDPMLEEVIDGHGVYATRDGNVMQLVILRKASENL